MTRDELQLAFDAVKRRAGYYEPIEGEDAEFLTALLKHHPQADDIVGPGIRHFQVHPGSSGWILSIPTSTVVVVRTDGREAEVLSPVERYLRREQR